MNPIEYSAVLKAAIELITDRSRHHEAIRICDAWIEDHPNDPCGYSLRGSFYVLQDRPDLALLFIEKAVSLGLDTAGTQFSRGEYLAALGRHVEAIAAFERAIIFDAHDGVLEYVPHFHVAECYRLMGKNKEAIAWCARIPDDFGYPGFHGLMNASKHTILDKIPAAPGPARGAKGGSRKRRR